MTKFKNNNILLWLFWGSVLTILGQFWVTNSIPLWLALPMSLMLLWFWGITKSKVDSWLRLATLGAIQFLVFCDLIVPHVDYGQEESIGKVFMQCLSVASYLFYAAGYLTKAPLRNGFLRQSPFWIGFISIHLLVFVYILLLAPRYEWLPAGLYCLSVLFFFIGIVNAKTSVKNQDWRVLITGCYILCFSELYVAANDMIPDIVCLTGYFLGDFLIITSTARVIRREREIFA